ncbi:MAG: hypothetical protein V1760_01430, partial [Candidatus Peregrinibacteria bacterium]
VFLRNDVAAKGTLDGMTYHTFAEELEDLAAMGTVVQMAERDNWTANAAARGQQLQEGFETIVRPKSLIDFSTHGRGLMFAVLLDTEERVKAVLKQAPLDGWVCGKGGVDNRVLRIAPPINSSEALIDELIKKAADTFASKAVEEAA